MAPRAALTARSGLRPYLAVVAVFLLAGVVWAEPWGPVEFTADGVARLFGLRLTDQAAAPTAPAGSSVLWVDGEGSLILEDSGPDSVRLGPKAHGGLYMTAGAAEPVLTNTPELVAGTTAASTLRQFTHNGLGRLTYTGATTRIFQVTFTGSFEKTSGGATLVTLHIYRDGADLPGTNEGEVDRSLGAGTGDHGATAITVQVILAQNQFVEVWYEADANVSLKMDHMQLVVAELE